MIDEVNTARDVALLSINATLDGRLTPVPRRDGGDGRRAARVRGAARLQPRARRRDRHPRRLALPVPRDARGHEQLGGARASSARRRRWSTEAMRLDRQRTRGEDGLCWTPQFRDIESLWRMSERVGERAALAFFASNLHEQVQAGRSRTPRRPPPAGCSTRPATAGCASRRAAVCRTSTATRGRSPHDAPPAGQRPAGGVRAAAAPRRRAARTARPRLPGPVGPLDA